MIKGQNSAEQIVIISSSTTLRLMRGMATTSDIKIGDFATAIGEPNDKGEIQASFIRIIPPPPITPRIPPFSTSTLPTSTTITSPIK